MSTLIPARAAGSRAKFTLLLLGSFGGIMAVGAASAAGTGDDARSVSVKYSQESLATDAGVNALYRRITFAATQVCPDVSIRELAAHARVVQCRAQAVARAIHQIDNPRLAALQANHAKNG